jgi:tetratricopeptide (TPR) repeat protein
MQLPHREYLLKGLYLGLLVLTGLRASTSDRFGLQTPVLVTLFSLGGLAVGLGAAGYAKLRQGYRIHGRLPAFLLFLLLESPTLVYAGILFGTMGGAILLHLLPDDTILLTATIGGGIVLGFLFGLLRQLADRRLRLVLSLVLGAGLVGGAIAYLEMPGAGDRSPDWAILGLQLLLGVPVFYLLTFSGREEESELEIGALCAALGLGSALLAGPAIQYRPLAFGIPALLYLFYTIRVMPKLRVFKHALRGLSYLRLGRFAEALRAFRRALQLDPQNETAREGFWRVHRALDLEHLADDPQTLAMVDFDLCLDRAGSLLMEPPTPDKLAEAERLLNVTAKQRPELSPAVDYWHAVARMHAKQPENSAEALARVLNPQVYGADQPQRQSVLLRAWQLALTGPEALRGLVGQPELQQPGRRMEAIAAVERRLVEVPDDQTVWGLKRVLYQDLTEKEYLDSAGAGTSPIGFDAGYAQQLGLALLNDKARRPRGSEYLRMAAHAQPANAPSMLVQLAQAHDRAGEPEAAWITYEWVKRAGRSVGPKNLAESEKQPYFAVVKMLAEAAEAAGEHDKAIENYQLFSESEKSGVETLRHLAGLHEAKGDPLSALRVTERALLYNAKDKDFLERKDKYTYSVMPEQLRAARESVRSWFDVDYCLRKARELLGPKYTENLEYVDWASHLIELARVMRPDVRSVKVLHARTLLRRGEKQEAVALLESAYSPKPESFADGEDEEAWYLACRLLGELYLYELGRADLAVPCFTEFRHSSKSGADTIYKLAQAYEQIGDLPRALKCYKQVTGYDSHPLAPDAREALYRLEAK